MVQKCFHVLKQSWSNLTHYSFHLLRINTFQFAFTEIFNTFGPLHTASFAYSILHDKDTQSSCHCIFFSLPNPASQVSPVGFITIFPAIFYLMQCKFYCYLSKQMHTQKGSKIEEHRPIILLTNLDIHN